MGETGRVTIHTEMRDVVIVGAGPAGLTTAADLARAGHDVLVLEEHPEVGRPVHCTGVLGHEAFDELDLPRHTILAVTGAASFRYGHGEPVIVESDRIKAAVVDRPRFDAALADRARQAGATIRTSARVDGLQPGADGVTVTVRDDATPVRARACVLACGASYRFNLELGLGVPRAFVQTAQIETPYPLLPRIDVRLSRELAPGGFAWAVPFMRGDVPHARLGLFCDSDALRRFEAFTEQMAREAGLDPASIPTPRLKMLPLGPVKRTVADRIVAIGDAAGLVKPTTGGGIYYSILSGKLAAETLDDALTKDTLSQRHLQPCEDRWRERLGPDIRAGLAFRALATRIGDRGIQALIEVARVDGIVPLLKETADFNWHRRAALALMKHPAVRKAVLSSIWS
jgi:digeranylgeranylglycerophospholipid reductase